MFFSVKYVNKGRYFNIMKLTNLINNIQCNTTMSDNLQLHLYTNIWLLHRCDFLPKYTQIQLQIILFLLFWDVLWIINDLLAPLSLFLYILTKKDTKDHPLFLGPVYLHKDASQVLVARTTPLFLTFCLQIYFQ
jgi:hypothetical protein